MAARPGRSERDLLAFERLYRENERKVFALCLRLSSDAALAEACTHLGHVGRLQLDHHHVARPAGVVDLLDGEAGVVPAGLGGDRATFPLGNVTRQPGDQGADADRRDVAPLEEFQSAQPRRRANGDSESPAADRVEARPVELYVHRRAHPRDQRQIGLV